MHNTLNGTFNKVLEESLALATCSMLHKSISSTYLLSSQHHRHNIGLSSPDDLRMRDQHTGIQAFVAPYHTEDKLEPYQEYQAPKSSLLFTGLLNECYIEAVTDERFVLHVELPADFNFLSYKHVQILYTIGGTYSIVPHVERPKDCSVALKDCTSTLHKECVGGSAVSLWRGHNR